MREIAVIILYWITFYIFLLLTALFTTIGAAWIMSAADASYWLAIGAKYVFPLVSLICAVAVWLCELLLSKEDTCK